MDNLISINLITTVLYVAAFVYGLCTLFKKRSPLYFRLLVFGVGCFLLEDIYYLVDYICSGVWSTTFSFASFGAGGCYAFMFSANYGLFDGLVDDGGADALRCRKIGFIAPAVLLIILANGEYAWILGGGGFASGFLMILSKLFAFPAAYYHLKHLIMKDELDYLLTAIRPCNAIALCVILFDFLSDSLYSAGMNSAGAVTAMLLPLSLCGMMIAANKGVQKWMM